MMIITDLQLCKVHRIKKIQNSQLYVEPISHTPSFKDSGVIAEEGAEKI